MPQWTKVSIDFWTQIGTDLHLFSYSTYAWYFSIFSYSNSCFSPFFLPERVRGIKEYEEAMEKAKKDHLNIWRYGDITADDAKEFGTNGIAKAGIAK